MLGQRSGPAFTEPKLCKSTTLGGRLRGGASKMAWVFPRDAQFLERLPHQPVHAVRGVLHEHDGVQPASAEGGLAFLIET